VLALQVRSTACPTVAVEPVPDRVTVAGELLALLTNATEPLAAPVPAGANVTVAVVLDPAPRIFGSVRPLTLKPDPVAFAAEIVRPEFPPFVNVTVFVALLPTATLPNGRLVGEAFNNTVAAAVLAVPLSETGDAVFVALLASDIEPEYVPAVAGANFTAILAD
jgi:hypothetical protein